MGMTVSAHKAGSQQSQLLPVAVIGIHALHWRKEDLHHATIAAIPIATLAQAVEDNMPAAECARFVELFAFFGKDLTVDSPLAEPSLSLLSSVATEYVLLQQKRHAQHSHPLAADAPTDSPAFAAIGRHAHGGDPHQGAGHRAHKQKPQPKKKAKRKPKVKKSKTAREPTARMQTRADDEEEEEASVKKKAGAAEAAEPAKPSRKRKALAALNANDTPTTGDGAPAAKTARGKVEDSAAKLANHIQLQLPSDVVASAAAQSAGDAQLKDIARKAVMQRFAAEQQVLHLQASAEQALRDKALADLDLIDRL